MKRLLGCGLLALGCYSPIDKVTLRVELPAEAASRFQELEVLPHIAEVRREGRRGVVVLQLKRDARRVQLKLPDTCSQWIDLRELSRDTVATRALTPLFDVGPSERVVGIGRRFSLEARPGCAEARAARVRFEATGGAPLAEIASSNTFFTATSAATLPEVANGSRIAAVSARQQQKLRSELTFSAQLPDGRHFQRVLGVSTVARSSGLADVGTDHPVLLQGDGWRLASQPPESHAQLRPLGTLVELWPDVAGRYALTQPGQPPLALHSGRFEQTPLDCGRGDCHAAIAQSAALSPMTQVLASDLGGCHSLDNPACASACHATGEPGTSDGGFSHVQRALGLGALPDDYTELPHALQRLGGVGCLACHGPNKIPTLDQKLAVLRNDVCAVCHDAPPRYGHVQALGASRMGHADGAAETRQKPSCARCHTGWGALGHEAPASIAAAGITCSTCHDVHPHDPGHVAATAAAESLLRRLPLPETLPDLPASFSGVSRVCIGCHAPSSNSLRPEASAAAIVAGRGGFEPSTGAALSLAGPHTSHAKGCMSCHDSGPSDLQLGKSHAFKATDSACVRCHTATPARDRSLAQRAEQLLARLDPAHAAGSLDSPWHARYELVLPTPQQTRALRNVLLVLEDPAADVHHPRYATSLLDAAERFLTGTQP